MATLLEEALSPANLRLAWDEVADNQGTFGVDHLSIAAFRRNWEERLISLRRAVIKGRYQPKKLRQRRFVQPGSGKVRLLRIPTVTDRILQRAVLEVLEPVFEARFLDCSFGYRRGRGVKQALERLLVLRENGKRQVLDGDIDEFFERADHHLIMNFLEQDLPDDSLLPLVEAWLEVAGKPISAKLPAEETECCIERIGIPIGSPLSPLLANALLHRLDLFAVQRGYDLVRYADDFVVLTETVANLVEAHAQIGNCLQSLKLDFEPTKTRLTSFDEGFKFLGVWFKGDEFEIKSNQWEVRLGKNWRADWHNLPLDAINQRGYPG